MIRRVVKMLLGRRGDPLPMADVTGFEALARERLSSMAYDYIRTGGTDEITMRENTLGFERIRLSPNVLVDVSHLDTRVDVLGTTLDFPILLAPIAYQRMFHRDGELATARGASAAGAAMVVSSFTTTSIEDIARATRHPLWFQLYVQPDRGLTQEMVQRAVGAGAKVIVLTVDTPVLGARYAQLGFHLPAGIECVHLRRRSDGGGGTSVKYKPLRGKIYNDECDPTMSWRDLDWLRSIAGVPVVLKGIVNPDDATRAIEHGADGVIVSTHGGRNLDRIPSAIEALPRVADAVAGRIPILFDSGIRRGSDVLSALALGARAVLLGRPYAYGLSVAGAAGVERVISIVREEFERAMALTGRRSLTEIDSSVVWPERPNPVFDA